MGFAGWDMGRLCRIGGVFAPGRGAEWSDAEAVLAGWVSIFLSHEGARKRARKWGSREEREDDGARRQRCFLCALVTLCEIILPAPSRIVRR